MKKLLFVLVSALSLIFSVNAQNSAVEADAMNNVTKAEKFLKESTFYREDTYVEMEETGIRAWAKVATDLKTGKKIGYCYFMTESKLALAMFTQGTEGGASQPLGYLDMDEIDDMIKALKKIVEITRTKSPNDYSINYITKSGIDVFYDSEEKKVTYSKEWSYVNQYGVRGTYRITSPVASINAVKKTIAMLEQAKIIINQNLK